MTSICELCNKTISEVGFMQSEKKEVYMDCNEGHCNEIIIHNNQKNE